MRKRTWAMSGIAVVAGAISFGSRGTAQDPKPKDIPLGIKAEPVCPAPIFSEPCPPAIQRPFFNHSSPPEESAPPRSTPEGSPEQSPRLARTEPAPVEIELPPQAKIDVLQKRWRAMRREIARLEAQLAMKKGEAAMIGAEIDLLHLEEDEPKASEIELQILPPLP